MSDENKHPDTEQLILEAAEEEFLTKGFDGARTTAIAERAGTTHAMLHYYYRTKEKLFEKVIETKIGELQTVMFGFINKENLPIAEYVEKGMRRHFEYLKTNRELPLFVMNELRRSGSRMLERFKTKKNFASKIQASLQNAIDRGVKNGECRKVDSIELMLDILSLNIFPFLASPILTIMFDEFSQNSEAFLEERLEENIHTILNKLKP